MNIVIVHNRYRHRGGEDVVVESEADLLRSHGHSVALVLRTNDDIAGKGALTTAIEAHWSTSSYKEMVDTIDRTAPDVVHVHNTFPLISPAIIWAAHSAGAPVVLTLHNFRLLCAQAMFLRDGRVCEDCLGRLPWRGVARACYRGSRLQSMVLVSSLALHRVIGTYQTKVSRFIALNDFCRSKFIEGGLPPEKVITKPNFVDSPARMDLSGRRAGGLFVGRLSEEKGVLLLAKAAALRSGIHIAVVGEGPLTNVLEAVPGLLLLGWLSQKEVAERMTRAAYLIMPSIWYENFPRTLVEAFACGLPVIASRIGALAELVEHGRTGLLFDAGSAEALAKQVAWAEENPEAMLAMGQNARREYEAKYTPDLNYAQLMDIYKSTLEGGKRVA